MATRRIDAHQHYWIVARGDYGWMTPDLGALRRDYMPDDLRPLLNDAGIAGTILVQAAPTIDETRFLLKVAASCDTVLGVVGWVDMAAADAADAIAGLAGDPRLRGIRPMIQDIPDPDWMLRPELEPAFEALKAHGLRFDALVKPWHLKALLRLLERHPDLPVVIDHGAKPRIRDGAFDDWARDMALIARETGATCKLSGLATEAPPGWTADTLRPWADHLLDAFGPERTMWGSDWPVLTLAGGYADWWRATGTLLAGLDDGAREQVLGGTAARFYGV